ncbi:MULTISPECIES: prepilin-type N-terminal cleavage/methylation domain-containing protein [Lysinibacillus]|uniref:prepilin-type N-terminal cleavage/methylation domain-containing protein n=1 Tax=Lysinibacillus TaxID=400634 RepID=UPI00214A929E|nr:MULTISPECIES: prepilin-type N-terminal cleavage/methylation domain-containing protein [Lysinibacillus]UUV25635.1 prepilin-type N-terminal cleavage/methylation domain-containing protein [Lysinibacillus sp. FN11]UYB48510.1 prepilin-type N-terminal cleavage/methylation domain-containing protein [Lysinibacillus capsici]
MLKKWKNKKLLKNEKGLTLVELLAVIVILAIIAAIAVPAIGNIINKSKDRAILAEASNILAGAKIAYIDGACTDGKCNAKALEPFVDGIDLKDTSVTFEKDTWSIKYPKFDSMKTALKLGKTEVTEKELNEALTSAGEKPASTSETPKQ